MAGQSDRDVTSRDTNTSLGKETEINWQNQQSVFSPLEEGLTCEVSQPLHKEATQLLSFQSTKIEMGMMVFNFLPVTCDSPLDQDWSGHIV